MRFIFKLLSLWITIAGLAFLVYMTGQQMLRIGANDPQIQIAEDTAEALSGGENISSTNGLKVDVSKSLAPYLVVYDKTGKAIAGTGYLDNKLAVIPPGIFDYVGNRGEDRVTWQPRAGVRSAIVITKFSQGFVMAGKSLREVEKRENDLGIMVLAGTIGMMLVSGLVITAAKWKKLE